MTRRTFGRRQTLATAAASLLAGARPLPAQERRGGELGDLKDVKLQGRLVDLGQLLARKYGARTNGAGPEKQWALVLPEGQLYTFIDNDRYRQLLAAKLFDKPVEIEAHLFPRSQVLEVTAFRSIPEDTLRRRFYCNVCAIHFDEFGPCVCCGEEVQPVKG